MPAQAKCFVCKGDTGRFRLPSDLTRKTKWMRLLNVKDTNCRICENHFEESDIYLTKTGKKYLREGAEPLPYNISNGMLSDVTVICENKKFFCHKVVLASQSGLLREILKEECDCSIFLPDISSSELQNLLKFLYTGQCFVKNVEDFIKILSTFDIDIHSNHITLEKRKQSKGQKRKFKDQDKSSKAKKVQKTNNKPKNISRIIPRGLQNKSNWCYVNATLQGISCPPFFELMKKLASNIDHTNVSSPMLESILTFIGKFNITNNNSFKIGDSFEPTSVYKMLINNNGPFNVIEGRQEDAQEFLHCLLDGLSEEMSKLNIFEESADVKVTPIQSLFEGQYESVVTHGETSETKVETFFTLPLVIESNEIRSIDDALTHNFAEEELEHFVSSETGLPVKAKRRLSIKELPKILVLHLKRFKYEGGIQKVMKNVTHGFELNIPEHIMTNTSSNNCKSYKLQSIVYHIGKKATGGHYVSDTLNDKTWIHFDDSLVKAISMTNVLHPESTKTPYLLLYIRGDIVGENLIDKTLTEEVLSQPVMTSDPEVVDLSSMPQLTPEVDNRSLAEEVLSLPVMTSDPEEEDLSSMPVLTPEVDNLFPLSPLSPLSSMPILTPEVATTSSPQVSSMPLLTPDAENLTSSPLHNLQSQEHDTTSVTRGGNTTNGGAISVRYFLKQIMKYVSEASPNSSENFKIHTELNIKYLFDILEQCRPVGQQRMKSVSTSTEDPSKIHLSFKGNRYSSKEIRGSATIMYSSYKTFKFLRENSIVPLPSRRTVQRRTEKFRFGPKRNGEFLSLLKTKIEEIKEAESLILSFDEMDIHKEPSYSSKLKTLFPAHKVRICIYRS